MAYDPALQHRRSVRLANYDYSSPGLYFLTICTQNKALLFGEIVNGRTVFNPAGLMVERWWNRLPKKFPAVLLGEFVVMPNHVHALLGLSNLKDAGGPGPAGLPPSSKTGGHAGPPLQTSNRMVRPPALSRVVQWFKTMTTNAYFHGIRQAGWPALSAKLWQRNYYEHIVRNARTARRIAAYILENPQHWAADVENLAAATHIPDPLDEIIASDL